MKKVSICFNNIHTVAQESEVRLQIYPSEKGITDTYANMMLSKNKLNGNKVSCFNQQAIAVLVLIKSLC